MYPIEILSGIDDIDLFDGIEDDEINQIVGAAGLSSPDTRKAAVRAIRTAAARAAKVAKERIKSKLEANVRRAEQALLASRTSLPGTSHDQFPRRIHRSDFVAGKTFGKFQSQTIKFNNNIAALTQEFPVNLEAGYANCIGIIGFLHRGILNPDPALGAQLKIQISDDNQIYFDSMNHKIYTLEVNQGNARFIPCLIKANNNRIRTTVNFTNPNLVGGNIQFEYDLVFLLSNDDNYVY